MISICLILVIENNQNDKNTFVSAVFEIVKMLIFYCLSINYIIKGVRIFLENWSVVIIIPCFVFL